MSMLLRAMANMRWTENGAPTYASTLSDVLDFYYHAAPSRGQDDKIVDLFSCAYREDPLLALKALFYLRDVRGGQGERDSFRACLSWLAHNDSDAFARIMLLVPEYGRWDDLVRMIDHVPKYVMNVLVNLVDNQLERDYASEHPSLLGKWMPSENTSSKNTRRLARLWTDALMLSKRNYRQILSMLRVRIGIVESEMSRGDWEDIQYERVPSSAAKIYRKAFNKHDEERYKEYLADVKAGKKKIHSATLFPYDLVHEVLSGSYDDTIEAQWNALPNYADTVRNALVVCDTSGSMSGQPVEVAVSLAIYIAERNRDIFRDKFITFSANPEIQDIAGETLQDRVRSLTNNRDSWGLNTNFQRVFGVLLNAARRHNLPQEEMPTHIFVISDMEFDYADGAGRAKTNFENIKNMYEQEGYAMPQMVFWNVRSRAQQTPVTQNEKGAFLVSGCSPSIFKAAINSQAMTPFDLMLEVLNAPRYDAVTEAATC